MKITIYILGLIILVNFLFRNKYFSCLVINDDKLVKKKINLSFMLLTFILILISAFRGDFSTDYATYIYQIQIYANQSINQILQVRDFGYALIMRGIYLLYNNGFLCILMISVSTVLAYISVIKKESKSFFLSFVVFVALDCYIISFNLMRNILASGLVFAAMHNIWEKRPIKYFIDIILISLIHRSAIVMIPMYWILQINYKKRKNFIILISGIIIVVIAFIYVKPLALWGQAFIGMDYTSYDNFGLDFGNIGSALKTTAMIGFVLFNYKKIDYSTNKNVILINSCIFAWILQIFAANVLMFQRVGYYFSSAFIIVVPNLITKCKNKKTTTFIFLCLVLMYALFFQNSPEYYWIWENEKIMFW